MSKEEIKHKISVLKGIKYAERYGVVRSLEIRNKQSKSQMGHATYYWTDAQRQKQRLKNLGKDNPNYGHKWNDKQKLNMRNKFKTRVINGISPVFTNTKPHLKLEEILQDMGYLVEKEVEFGGFFLDCYLPKLHLGFEADGPFHAKNRDMRRDSFLMEKFKLPILRIEADFLMKKDNQEVVRKNIISFINLFSESSIERKEFCPENLYKATCTKDFYSWKKGKTSKVDKTTGLRYWVDMQIRRFICPVCGNVLYISEKDIRQYCSQSCASKARGPRISIKKSKNVACIGCGIEFLVTKSSKRKYCNINCYHKNSKSWNTGLTKSTSAKLTEIGKKISLAEKGVKRGKYEDYLSPEEVLIQKTRIKENKCKFCGKFMNRLGVCVCK